MDLYSILWWLGFPVRECFKYAIKSFIGVVDIDVTTEFYNALFEPTNHELTIGAFIFSLPFLICIILLLTYIIRNKALKRENEELWQLKTDNIKKENDRLKFKRRAEQEEKDHKVLENRVLAEMPYRKRGNNINSCSPLTTEEQKFYKFGLCEVIDPARFTIMPKVNLREFVVTDKSITGNSNDKNSFQYIAFTQINWKNVDFLITDKKSNILFAVEYDDEGHMTNENTIANDRFKNKLFAKLNIPLIRIPYKRYWGNNECKYLYDRLFNNKDISSHNNEWIRNPTEKRNW